MLWALVKVIQEKVHGKLFHNLYNYFISHKNIR